MTGQLCWLSKSGDDGEKILHVRLESYHPWKPYNLFPGIAVPDYRVPKGSKGWATFQKLFRLGWQLIPTTEAYKTSTPIAALSTK